MSPRFLLTLALAVLALASQASAMSEAQRRDYLDWMLKNLPGVPAWNDWQKAAGELPPDFDALPQENFLPDPLRFLDGRRITDRADWPARQAEIRRLLEKYQSGTFPPKPKLDRVVVLDETSDGATITRNVRLEFGPEGKGSVRVRVTIPPGGGRKPVLICPNLAGWAPLLVRRGYISAGFAGNDGMDDGAPLKALYPDYDFAALARRAWLVPLVVDYLETLPEVDARQLAIFGYSRDGKMAAMAMALEPRLAALVAGSTGVGGFLPWRLAGERGMGESIESTTRMFPTWLHPRIRFFSGREDRLPIEANLLLASIAPRAVLIEHGLNDEVTNVWANEQAYHSALAVYQLFGQPERLGLLRVPGFHGGNDQEACIDWLDIQFGRSTAAWKNEVLFPWSFDEWRRTAGVKSDSSQAPRVGPDLFANVTTPASWQPRVEQVRAAAQWILGEAPPAFTPRGPDPQAQFFARRPPPPGPTTVAKGTVGNPGQLGPDVPAWVISRGGQEFGWLEPEKNQTDSRRMRFGTGLTGDLFFPANTPAGTKLPTVIWLHGYSYPLGYMWVYRRDLHPILALVKAGYAVFAFDQFGFGSRQADLAPFYRRYPAWSQLGRMVEDTRGAIDALEKDNLVDAQRIYALGHTLGGHVALHTALFEPRLKGVVAVSAFTPMRTDTAQRATGGLARFSRQRPLAPRLGLFIGREGEVPYDYDALLAALAPRPVLVVQPSMDRDASPEDVRRAVEQARRVYAVHQAGDRLALLEPHDYQRLPAATQDAIVKWMSESFSVK